MKHFKVCLTVKIASKVLTAGEQALPRPPWESTRGKARKKDWRRERGDLDHPRFMTDRHTSQYCMLTDTKKQKKSFYITDDSALNMTW